MSMVWAVLFVVLKIVSVILLVGSVAIYFVYLWDVGALRFSYLLNLPRRLWSRGYVHGRQIYKKISSHIPTRASVFTRIIFAFKMILGKLGIGTVRPGGDRIELSLAPDYVGWDIWASIREFFQNAKDADDLGMAMSVVHDPAAQLLTIANQGARLERSTLVLGSTSKRGTEQRGKFGEGYKLALASLLQLGHKITIHNWDEIWTPSIEWSAVYETMVMVINIKPSILPTPQLGIVVDKVSAIDYKNISSKLLFDKEGVLAAQTMADGILLTDKQYVGKLYVKGIYINELPGMFKFGYDLFRLKINRDRSLADPWSLDAEIHKILNAALVLKILTAKNLFEAFEEGFDELQAIKDGNCLGSVIPQLMVAEFTAKYRETAVPVGSQTDSSYAQMRALKPIFCSQALIKILARGGLSFVRPPENKELDFSKTYNHNELTNLELNNLKTAVSFVNQVERTKLSEVGVVDFNSKTVAGLWKGGKIYLSRKTLSSKTDTVSTLVHEVGHHWGDDGSIGHRSACERIFSKIICNLAKDLESV